MEGSLPGTDLGKDGIGGFRGRMGSERAEGDLSRRGLYTNPSKGGIFRSVKERNVLELYILAWQKRAPQGGPFQGGALPSRKGTLAERIHTEKTEEKSVLKVNEKGFNS